MTLTTPLLQAANPGAGWMNIIMIVLLIAIFYFFMIRPQSKRQKEIQKAREAMKPGDKIITSGGVYGIIRDINTTTNQVTVEIWDGVKMKVDFNNVYAIPDNNTK